MSEPPPYSIVAPLISSNEAVPPYSNYGSSGFRAVPSSIASSPPPPRTRPSILPPPIRTTTLPIIEQSATEAAAKRQKTRLLFNFAILLSGLLCLQILAVIFIPHHLANRRRGTPRAGDVVFSCTGLDRAVALTYDDGPSTATHELLDTLKELNVKATFFVVGINALQLPQVVQRAFNEGHTIASHTYSHANLTHLHETNHTELAFQIEENEKILTELTGERPKLIRPPYGAINKGVRKFLEKKGYTVIMWNTGCIDWWLDDPTREIPIYINGMPDAGSILCMHDSYASTARSAANLTKALRGTDGPFANPQGRRVVGMKECLEGRRDEL